jgi:hypothetical protein
MTGAVVASGVDSTVADAFSSVAGAVVSAGDADSSCAMATAATNADANKEMMIFM